MKPQRCLYNISDVPVPPPVTTATRPSTLNKLAALSTAVVFTESPMVMSFNVVFGLFGLDYNETWYSGFIFKTDSMFLKPSFLGLFEYLLEL
jgi:hypothetical protein